MLEGGIPGHGAGRRNASLPHRAQMEPNVIVYARRNLQLLPTATTLGWARRNQRGGVQQRARPWQANNQDLDTGAIDQPAQLRSYPVNRPILSSLQVKPPSGRATTTSVIDTINRRAYRGKLSGTYPYSSKQSNPALLHAIRLQLRCNPDRRRNVRTRFFHRICMPAGPMERAPV